MTKSELKEQIELFEDLVSTDGVPEDEKEMYRAELPKLKEQLAKMEDKPTPAPKKPVAKKTEPKPKAEPTKTNKDRNPYNIDLSKEKQPFGKNYEFVKMKEDLFLLKPNDKEYSSYEFEKKDGKWHVTCVTKDVKTFKTLQGAVNYVGKTLYTGELRSMIKEKQAKAEKQKEWREKTGGSIPVSEKIENAAEAIETKVETHTVSKVEAEKSVDGIKDIVKAVKNNMKSRQDGVEFVKKLIAELQKLISN